MTERNVNAFGTDSFQKQKLESLTKSEANENYVNVKGDYMEGILNMRNNQIKNLAIPTEKNDAVSKKYVESEIQLTKSYVDDSKHKMTKDLDMNNQKIINVGRPENHKDAMNIETFTRYYHDLKKEFASKSEVDQTKQSITNDIEANNQRISTLKNEIKDEIQNTATAIANHHQSKFLALDGTSKPTNAIDFNNQKISNVKFPEFEYDAVNKSYVDNNIKKQIICITDRFHGGNKGWIFNSKNNTGIPMAYKGKLLKLAITGKNQNLEMRTSVVLNNTETNKSVFKPIGYKSIIAIFDEPLEFNENDIISFTNHDSLKPNTYLSTWIEIEID